MGYLTRSSGSGPKAAAPHTPLFEIRLNGLDRDVVVIKGPPTEASSVLLLGKIVLSTNEPMHIRKLSLKLYGDLRLNWIEHLESASATYSKPTRYLRRIYEHSWDNFPIQSYAEDGLLSADDAPEHAKLPFHLKKNSKSSTSLLSMNKNKQPDLASLSTTPTDSSTALNRLSWSASSNNNNSLAAADSLVGPAVISHGNQGGHTLARGNYEFPFLVFLPGNLNESVEGLPGGSVLYKLEASIERGKFTKKKVCSKHLRIIRTLTPDAPELAETMSIDNNWPNKIEYTISIPSRAMAIGSACPINFLMVPLLKGLKLGKITIKLVEYYNFIGTNNKHSHSNDRVISQVIIPKPDDAIYDETEPRLLTDDNPTMNPANNFMKLSYDRWELEKSLHIPPSLSKCTQDVAVGKNLKVRHKLSIVVALKNPNGHTSELRATLPVILYISPYVTVSAKYSEQAVLYSFSDSIPELSAEHNVAGTAAANAKNKKQSVPSPTYKKKSNPSSNSSSTTDLKALSNLPPPPPAAIGSKDFSEEPDDEILFSGAETSTVVDANTGRPDLVAPPNYGSHIYDKLWSDIETPGVMTPAEIMTPTGLRTPPNGYVPPGAQSAPGLVGARTPGNQTPTSSSLKLSQSKFNSQLTKHLNELHLQRLAEEENEGSIDSVTGRINEPHTAVSPPSGNAPPEFVIDSDKNETNENTESTVGDIPTPANNTSGQMDYFSIPKAQNRNGIATPMSPDAFHLSRSNSSNLLLTLGGGLQSPGEASSSWNNNSLSRVPSYETAMKSNTDMALLSPAYDVSFDNSSLTSINNPSTSQRPAFARAVSTGNLTKSFGSSGGTTPTRPGAKRNNSFLHLRFGGGNNNALKSKTDLKNSHSSTGLGHRKENSLKSFQLNIPNKNSKASASDASSVTSSANNNSSSAASESDPNASKDKVLLNQGAAGGLELGIKRKHAK